MLEASKIAEKHGIELKGLILIQEKLEEPKDELDSDDDNDDLEANTSWKMWLMILKMTRASVTYGIGTLRVVIRRH